jgi:hypothetical protein
MWHWRKSKSCLSSEERDTHSSQPSCPLVVALSAALGRTCTTRLHPTGLNSDKTFTSEKLAALATTRLLISNPSHFPSSFLSLPPSLHAQIRPTKCYSCGHARRRWEGCLFFYFFFLIPVYVDTILTRTLPASHLLSHVRMQLRKLVRFIIILS